MFKDYYAILELSQNADLNQIKAAFKKQALKWHPDRNIGVDTTSIMQTIVEAHLILKDQEARIKYDEEYRKFNNIRISQDLGSRNETSYNEENVQFEYQDYEIEDNELTRWILNARRQAVEFAKITIEDLKGMTIEGAKAGMNGCLVQFVILLIISIVASIIRAC
ncbi:MAG: J domain-containing protein [Bacteroidia bacterium]|uniref:J domain-containing protein n=1 Tax=Candidatus Brachybacter algidus TaxID=2982024 RepID=UPI001B5978E5|nr:J domain-containing protein [Candidatus Brachybacter algidus]MBK6450338.1 J domain-containing protein [Candidatus Brachybacter algidus]MBL0120549.1 J domain-containing protein [Candidatus Brachybacter algidus]MBP9922341.1 J domain-containing protein [Bacteroidia bacterium]